MDTKKTLTIRLVIAALAFPSCNEDHQNDNPTGELILSVDGLVLEVATRSTNTIPVTVDDLSVAIHNSQGQEQAKYGSVADVPETITLPRGSYKVSAYYGSAADAGFEAYYIHGEKEFVIESNNRTAVSLTCGIGNVQAAVYYGENIAAGYKDYYVDIWEAAYPGKQVRFTKDEERVGFVPAGTVALRVTLVKENGETVTSTPDPIQAPAATFLKLYLDTKGEADSDVSFKIVISDQIEDIELDIELPSFILPPAEPTLLPEGFDGESNGYSFTEGVEVQGNLQIAVDAAAGIKSAIVTSSPELRAAGWPATFDLADSDNQALINNLGIDLPGDFVGATTSTVSLARVAPLLTTGATATDYSFTLEVTDKVDQSTGPHSYSFTVNPPEFTLNQPAEGDVWATRLDIGGTFTSGNPALLEAEIKRGDAWTAYDLSGITPGAFARSLHGLTPGAEHSVRLKYNSHFSEQFTFCTEDALQVPNNDFEEYCSIRVNSSHGIDTYFFWDTNAAEEEKWWSTRNTASNSQTNGVFAAYTHSNGTTPVDNGQNGSAVQIQTTAWGRGTTSAGSASTIYNITAGILFIGDYDCVIEVNTSANLWIGWSKMTSETVSQGRPFTSRPAKFEFQYKYAPYNNEYFLAYAFVENREGNSVTELGRASVSQDIASRSVDSMTDLSVAFEYNDAYKNLKATHISVFFSSSNIMGWAQGETRPYVNTTFAGGLMSGSTLTVDNLRFDYDFN